MIEEKYYTWEYDYLDSAAKEFAEKHDTIARYLNIEERFQKDPFVERLCQAFAFLTGRIHERLDDDFPELSGALLEHIFPQLLRPFPSCSILTVQIESQQLTSPVPVPRKAEVQASFTDGGRQTELIFRTIQDLTVLPVELRGIKFRDAGKILRLPMYPRRNVSFQSLGLKTLRLFINGTERRHYTLLFNLARNVKSVKITQNSKTWEVSPFQLSLPGLTFAPNLEEEQMPRNGDGQKAKDSSVLPNPVMHQVPGYVADQFAGYRLLQEYFAFPQKFFFVDIAGFGNVPEIVNEEPFEIWVEFDSEHAKGFDLKDSDVLINAVPIVNLFDDKGSIQPVKIDGLQPEYLLLPENTKTEEIYAVMEVKSSQDIEYAPMTSFQTIRQQIKQKKTRFYTTKTTRSDDSMSKTHLRLIQDSHEVSTLQKDILSVRALLFNGNIPQEKLAKGSITQTSADFEAGLKVQNVTNPTPVLKWPLETEYLWNFVSHLTVNLRRVTEKDTLQRLLAIYNWQPDPKDSSRTKISEGILDIRPPNTKTIFQNGGLKKIIEIEVEINLSKFEFGEGDVFLFGSVLHRFLAEYVTFNTDVSLTLFDKSEIPNVQKVYSWPPLKGRISAL